VYSGNLPAMELGLGHSSQIMAAFAALLSKVSVG
jgi:hypothetical protein